ADRDNLGSRLTRNISSRFGSSPAVTTNSVTIKNSPSLVRTIHEYLIQRPIVLHGEAFLPQSPRRTAGTPASATVREATAGFGLERLATVCMNNPGERVQTTLL
ncbi:MAG TPA: hypothetical protein VJT11_04505, partial [Nitrospiraceae bacterium]|nr:hypothetical protein [Nitrospiraceae bacterium]